MVVVASQWGLLGPVAQALWVVVDFGAGSLVADQYSPGPFPGLNDRVANGPKVEVAEGV